MRYLSIVCLAFLILACEENPMDPENQPFQPHYPLPR